MLIIDGLSPNCTTVYIISIVNIWFGSQITHLYNLKIANKNKSQTKKARIWTSTKCYYSQKILNNGRKAKLTYPKCDKFTMPGPPSLFFKPWTLSFSVGSDLHKTYNITESSQANPKGSRWSKTTYHGNSTKTSDLASIATSLASFSICSTGYNDITMHQCIQISFLSIKASS